MRPAAVLVVLLVAATALSGCTTPAWLSQSDTGDGGPEAFPPRESASPEPRPDPAVQDLHRLVDPVLADLPWAQIVNATDPMGLGNTFQEFSRPDMRWWASAAYPEPAGDPERPPFPGYGHPDYNAAGYRVDADFQTRDGTRLDGTIYFPPNATPADGPFPALMFMEGLRGAQSMYQWWHLAFAERGYVVFAFDFPGQGESDGEPRSADESWADDGLDALDHFLRKSPAAPFLDPERVGVIGHSKGAITLLEMLHQDPRIRVAVAAAPIHHSAAPDYAGTETPLMVQSGDHDGPIAPLPFTAPYFARGTYLMALGDAALINFEAGTHGCHTNYPFVPMPTWCNNIGDHYATAWIDAHLLEASLEPVKQPVDHLSTLHVSEYTLDGERGVLAGEIPPSATTPTLPLGSQLRTTVDGAPGLVDWSVTADGLHVHAQPLDPTRTGWTGTLTLDADAVTWHVQTEDGREGGFRVPLAPVLATASP